MKKLLDKGTFDPKRSKWDYPFVYRNAAQTDLRQRFADIAKALEAEARADMAKVTSIKKVKK